MVDRLYSMRSYVYILKTLALLTAAHLALGRMQTSRQFPAFEGHAPHRDLPSAEAHARPAHERVCDAVLASFLNIPEP